MIVAVMCSFFAGQVLADPVTVTYTVNDKTSVTTSGTAPVGSSVTFSSNGNTAEQLTAGTNQVLTLSGYSGYTITGLKLNMKSNSSKGAGALFYSTDGGSTYTYLVGSGESNGTSIEGVAFNDGAWHGSWSTSFVDITKSVTINASSSNIIIKIRATQNSLYCHSYTLTYTPAGGDTPTPTTYAVTYNPNGGSGTMTDSNSPYVSGATVTVLDNAFTRDGYDFVKWNTAADGTGTDYDADDTFTISANTTLYAQWEEQASGDEQWVLTSLSDLTSSDVFVIVGNNGSNYAMSNGNGTSSAPAAVSVTIEGSQITSTVASNIKWNISGNASDGYTFYPNGDAETWLYCTNTNNGVRVGTNESKTFKVDNGYLKHNGTSRYVGIYNSQDWRCYTSNGGNIANQTFAFYKKVTGDVIPPSITASTNEIAYDATSGSITYSVTNPVEGGAVTATSSENWLTVGTPSDGTIALTCAANSETTERTATVTLTYTYNTNETVTTTVTVTQAGAPVVYTTIPALFAAATSTATDVNITFGGWVVSAVQSNNAYLTDNQGNGLIIYATGHGFQAGDVLTGTVSCKLQLYRGSAELTELTTSTTGLSVAHNGTVTEQNIAISELSGVNTGALLAYQGLTFNGTALVDVNDNAITPYNTLSTYTLESGKTYNVKGIYLQFNETKELLPRTADDFVEVQKLDNSIIMVGPDYTIDVSVSGGGEVNMTSAAASHGTLQSEVVLASTTVDASKYTFANKVLTVHDVTEGGVIVIRYYVDADAEYNAVELLVPIYLKANPIIAYDGETESTAYGTPYTIDTDLISGGNITLSSGNTAVATVNDLTITPVAVGSTTITINTAETNIWFPGTATFTLNVTAPEGKETAAPTGSAGGTIFEETFADCVSTGGNDNNFATAGNTEISTANDYTDNDGWVISKGYPAKGCLKFGGSKASGGAITPSITATIGTTYTLSFKAAPWNTESTTMNVSVDGGTISGLSEDAMSTGEWNDFTASITATATSFTVTFGASNNRFFLDEVKVEAPASPAPAITATLNGRGYATFCSEYPLDFSDYETAGYSAWQITGVSGETITFSQITGSIMGGQGILLKGTAGETIELTSANSTTTLNGNLLEGTLAPTYVAADEYYGLSGNEFVKVNAGTVPAGKALLPASVLSSNVKAFTFVFEDDATGINEELRMKNEESSIYNLAGQRLDNSQFTIHNSQLKRGIYIVNGKKVLK